MRPEAEEYLGHYVRAIHDFHAGAKGEITLETGDIFKVTKAIDKNWLNGKGQKTEGNFPTDFVEKVVMPPVEEGQKVFAATDSFPSQQDGDLEFRKGQIIVGLQAVDANWWQGQLGSEIGIFPLSHVMELEQSKLLRHRSKSVHSAEPLFAQALVDSKAQLDGELGFVAGEIIQVTDVIDEDWYRGEINGKTGMFLAACVDLLNDSMEVESESNNNKNTTNTADDTGPEPEPPTASIPHQDAPLTGVESSRPKSISFSEEVDMRSKGNNSHDASGQETDTNRHSKTGAAYTSENTKSHGSQDVGVTPYGRTLYPFTGESADELSFDANDIVTLIQHVDEQWIEGELDGKIGLFPLNYVEIIVDCPYAYSINQSDSTESSTAELQYVNEDSTNVTNQNDLPHEEEEYALVKYTFQAETNHDLSVQEGDTVTVIKRVDANWVLAQDDKGDQGLCPMDFLEIIGTSPDHDFASRSKDTNSVKPENTASHLPQTDSVPIIKSPHTHAQQSEKSTESTKLSTSQSLTDISSKLKSKPALKPKPQIAPKPTLKPKPSLVGPKLVVQDVSNSLSPASLSPVPDNAKSLSKSASTKSFSAVEDSLSDSRAQSPSVSQTDKVNDGSSIGLLPSDNGNLQDIENNVNSGRRNSMKEDGQKVFIDWDMTKPLGSLLKEEFQKAETHRLRSHSNRSTGSGSTESVDKSHKTVSDEVDIPALGRQKVRPVSWAASKPTESLQSKQANYSRTNFFDGLSEDWNGTKAGNSTFFKPEQPSTSSGKSARKPTLRKHPPPRPKGPKLAPLPSKTPLEPSKCETSSVTSTPQRVPSRPAPSVPPPSTKHGRKHARPAPQRPGQAGKQRKGGNQSSTLKEPAKGDNLMSFSPNCSVDLKDCTDPEAAAELRTRISEMEKDLEQCKKSKSELYVMCENVDENDQTEIHDNIQFYEENVRGITKELDTLRENLRQLCPQEQGKLDQERLLAAQKDEEEKQQEEMKKKMALEKKGRRINREKVINELFQTEKDFIQSLSLIMETFLSPATEKHADIDVELLFGNIEEVADISQRLLTKLEESVNGKDFSQQVIGVCFITLAEDMKNVYAPYCRNHDDVITLIEKYRGQTEVKEYIDSLLDEMREQCAVFDLEALLIKPVQRILKYPLLLNALIKTTDEDHPDRKEILEAITAMTDVATAINEYKRRKDLVYKYKKEVDSSIGDKLAKLSLHSIKKKSSRIRERFSANLGFIDQTRDENFDRLETRHRNLEKTVKIFVKDVQLYMDHMQDIVSSMECLVTDIEDFYGEKGDLPEVQKYKTVQGQLQDSFLPAFKVEVEDLVLQPLVRLIQTYDGPNKVVQKRYDKLLDYDNLSRKAKDDRVPERTVQVARQDYEALNAQLLDELPRLYSLSFTLFTDCMGSFVRAQREFMNSWLHDIYPLMDILVPAWKGSLQFLAEESTIEVFGIKHTTIVDRLAVLSFMPRNFSPRVPDVKPDKKSKKASTDMSARTTDAASQSDSQKAYVIQQYAGKLFRVNQMHVKLDMMDVSLSEGEVVGVIKEQDPMGNKERWFVHNGAIKGFVPKKILIPYEQSPAKVGQVDRSSHLVDSPDSSPVARGSQYNRNSAVLKQIEDEDDIDFALEEDMTPSLPQADSQGQSSLTSSGQSDYVYHNQAIEEDEDERLPALYYAAFRFEARSSNEVSLFEHQVVSVLAKHDQDGNLEWWYVDADGRLGYTPAAYLNKMDSHGGPT